jgi:plastocyanin
MRKIALAVALLLCLPLATIRAATVPVTVGPGTTFSPSTVNVVVGDTVQWTWAAGSLPHSTTSNTNTGAEVWDSGVKSTGTFSHTFTTVGNWGYYCTIHSTPTGTAMNGVVHVAAAAPTLASVNPNAGPTAGGQAVTLTGTNFGAGCSVTFGASPATAIIQNSTTISATTPAHAAGVVNVAVACPGGTATLTNGFTFADGPTITAVQPPSSPPGLQVTIIGTAFQNGATVTFGGTAATNVAFVNSGTITATVPNIPPGAAAVVVTNPDTQTATFNGFTVLASTAIPLLDPRAMWILAAALAVIAVGVLRARGF